MTTKNQAPEGALRQVLRELETARDYITKSLEGAKEAYQGHPDRWAAEERDLADTDAAIAAGRAALAAQPEPGTAQWCAKCGEGVTPGLCRRKDALAYQQANPLGGPAKVFRAMADAIEAGDSYEDTLRRFEYAEVKPSPAEGDEIGDDLAEQIMTRVCHERGGLLDAVKAGYRAALASKPQPKGTVTQEPVAVIEIVPKNDGSNTREFHRDFLDASFKLPSGKYMLYPHAAPQASEGAASGELTDAELLVGELVAATLEEERAHAEDEDDREKGAIADRWIRARDKLLRALRAAQAPAPAHEPVGYWLEGSSVVEFGKKRDYHDGPEWTAIYAHPSEVQAPAVGAEPEAALRTALETLEAAPRVVEHVLPFSNVCNCTQCESARAAKSAMATLRSALPQ